MDLNATLWAQIVVFLVLAGVTAKFIWPPLIKAIDDRAAKIADGLAAADRAKTDLANAEKKAGDELKKARESASELRNSAESQAAKLLEDARAEAARIVSAAREAAEAEAGVAAQRVREALRDQVVALAVVGAEKILRKEINPQVHAELLTQLKSEL